MNTTVKYYIFIQYYLIIIFINRHMEETSSRRISSRRTAQANYNQTALRSKKKPDLSLQGVKTIVKCGSSTKNIVSLFL